MDLVLTLKADRIGAIQWRVDISSVLHNDMYSYTGGVMTFGKGVVYLCSIKQRFNTKHSTEILLVGMDDLMPQVLWTRYFVEFQAFNVTDNFS